MPTYLYEDRAGERAEVTQRITEKAYDWRDPHTGEWGHDAEGAPKREGWAVRRLIAGCPRFTLVSGDSGGWGAQGYSKTEPQRQAEATLGRKLHKPV